MKHVSSLLAFSVVLAACCAAISHSALAGHYELIKGKGVEVCEAYGKNLNANPEPEPVRLCERKIMPGFEEFQKPAWQKLDVDSHRHLILAIERYLDMPLDYKATKSMYPARTVDNLFDYYDESTMRLYLAEFDMDNDGTNEPVVKYESWHCSPWDLPPKGPHWHGPLLVLTSDRQSLDIEKTYPLMQNRAKRYWANKDEIDEWFRVRRQFGVNDKERPQSKFEPSKYAPGVTRVQGYDVFFHEGKTYFDRWDEARNDGSYQTLTVYQTITKQTKELCQYQFKR